MTLTPRAPRLLFGAALALALHAVPDAASAADPKPANTAPAAKAGAAKTAPGKKQAARAPVETGPAAASPEQLTAADQVYYGSHECEFHQSAEVSINPKYAGYVDVKQGKSTYLMKPVLSTTGAIRLEDIRGQTLMVQIASKSMLLDVKAGRRIVDECISAKHREAMERHRLAKLAEAAAAAEAAVGGTPVLTSDTSATLLLASPPAAKPSDPLAAAVPPPAPASAPIPPAAASAVPVPPDSASPVLLLAPPPAAKASEPAGPIALPAAASSAAPPASAASAP